MNSNKHIGSYKFITLLEVEKFASEYSKGLAKITPFGIVMEIDFQVGCSQLKSSFNYYYETDSHYYYLHVKEHWTNFELNIYRTYFHPMITSAETGDLQDFIENFDERKTMTNFALRTAIEFDNLNIVKYLIESNKITENPIDKCLRYDRPNILRYLIDANQALPKSWLAMLIYHDVLFSAIVMIQQYKLHLNDLAQFSDRWFLKQIKSDNRTSMWIKNHLGIKTGEVA